ncbi:hypothetical protein [Afipia massiliensis]|nr:hypothetical protein [Afipia massiliensis]
MPKLHGRSWAFIGCISHEERCFSSFSAVAGSQVNPTFVRIFDEDPIDVDAELVSLDAQKEIAIAKNIPSTRIVDADLLATVDTIERILTEAIGSSSAVIIDITSFPKRWFFVIARLAKANDTLADIIYTYSLGDRYARSLSSNPEIVRTIPTFTSLDRRSVCDVALVGIGYHSQSVLNLFDIERPKSVTMLFPFPPGPPGISRNWKSVERLEMSIRTDSDALTLDNSGVTHLHLGALDLPQNFDAIRQVTDQGHRTSLVAPYGPKPVSLAMCLFALAAETAGRPDVPAYYSQPTRYALDYTTGISTKGDGAPSVFGYPVRLRSKELYVI